MKTAATTETNNTDK